MRNLNVKITLSLLGVLSIGPATGCTNGILTVSDVVPMPGVIAVDTIIPSVSIMTPTLGTTLSQNSGNLITTYQASGTNSNSILTQTMTMSGACYNNSSTVTFYIDSPSNAPWGSAGCAGASSTDQTCTGATCGTYTATLNALALTAGTHTLYAVVTDKFGTTNTASVSVTRKATYYLGRNFYTYKPVASTGGPTSDISKASNTDSTTWDQVRFVPVGTNGAVATIGIHDNHGTALAYYKDADVSIYRDVASKSGTGSASITLTPTLVSATSTDLPDTTPIIATFDETDTVAIVTAGSTAGTNFKIQTNSAKTGDKYFTVTLSNPSTPLGELIPTTGFGILAANPALASQAQINIIDPQIVDSSLSPYGDYIFGHSFVTVNNGQNGAITVQRIKGLSISQNVKVSLVDGSAITGTDYHSTGTDLNCGSSATDTATFSVNQDEVTCTIKTYATANPSRSFYAKLTTPSTGTYVRAQSIAKIRILKAETVDSTTTLTSTSTDGICYSTNTSSNISHGFGGGDGSSGHPFLICTAYHLSRVQAFSPTTTTYYYKMMADVDANPTNNGGTSIVQTAIFSGASFDGNERTIANFTVTPTSTMFTCTVQVVGGQPCAGFFASVHAASASPTVIKNMNMLYYSLTGVTGGAGGVIGVNGSASSAFTATLTDLFSTGYINTTGSYAGGVVGMNNPYDTTGADMHINNALTMGTIVSTFGYAGGIVGEHYDRNVGGAWDLSNVMSGANIHGTLYIGGIAGFIQQSSGTPAAVSISSDSRGYLSGSGSYVGGTAGEIYIQGDVTLSGTNYSSISCAGSCGGIIGTLTSQGAGHPASITATNYGAVSGSSGNIGGIIGHLLPNASTTTTITNCANFGPVSGTTTVGGIVGDIDNNVGPSITVTINTAGGTCSNSGAINGTTKVGGIVGGILGYNSDTHSTINNCSNLGSVTGTVLVGGVLGVYASETTSAATDNTLNIGGSSNHAAVTATTAAEAGGLVGHLFPGPSTIVTVDNTGGVCTNSGTVTSLSTGTGSAGGIVGNISSTSSSGGTGAGATANINGCTNSGPVTSGGFNGGILGVYTASITGDSTHRDALNIRGSSNTATVTGTFTSAKTGGLVGEIAYNASFATVTIDNNTDGVCTNSGAVASTGSGTSGIVGYITSNGAYDSTSTSVAHCNNSGSITGGSSVGGIIGAHNSWAADTVSNTALNILSSSNSANITATSGGNVGGVIGSIAGPTSGTGNLVTLAGTSSTYNGTHGSVSCAGCNAAGGLLGYWAPGAGQNTLTIASTGCAAHNPPTTGTKDCAIDSFSSSPVSGNMYIGGVIGYANMNHLDVTLSVTDTLASGNVTTMQPSNAYAGGFLGLIDSSSASGSTSMTLQRLTASGNVTGVSSTSSPSGSGSHNMGGFAGGLEVNVSTFTATKIGASGSVTGGDASWSGMFYGGLIGVYYGGSVNRLFSEVYASGNLNVETDQGIPTYSTTNVDIGGLFGGFGDGGTVTITDGYYSGTLNGGNPLVERYGLAPPGQTIITSYFAYASGGQNSSVADTTNGVGWLVNGATSSDSNYSGWDFTSIWNDATGTTRPTLR